MQFMRRLHEPIRAGLVTTSIRVWKSPRVRVGGAYRLGGGPGYIVIDGIDVIEQDDLSEEMAIESGFDGVADLMKVARHGSGKMIYFVRFHYVDGDLVP